MSANAATEFGNTTLLFINLNWLHQNETMLSYKINKPFIIK
jgi:flavorubredoxin